MGCCTLFIPLPEAFCLKAVHVKVCMCDHTKSLLAWYLARISTNL